MDRLSEFLRNVYIKIKAMSTGRKIAIGILMTGVILAVILYFSVSNANKYGVLFANLSATDAKNIQAQLDSKKADYKVGANNTIYVPTSEVYSMRMELAPSITGGSTGYELFDNMNQLGVSDDQFQIMKLRATQGELEKTIKSFPQIENARVLIAQQPDSVFVSDNPPGKVSAYIQLKQGMDLSPSQVKAMISLISGSLDNVPKSNVEIIDDKMRDLSAEASQDDSSAGDTISVQSQRDAEIKFQNNLQDAIKDLLTPVFGADKVKAQVNVNMNFDSTEKTTIEYNPNKVLLSSHIIVSGGNLGTASLDNSGSPVDNNMGNVIVASPSPSPGVNNITSADSTNNYDVPSTQTKTLNAPGEITRLTASVMIDTTSLDNTTKTQIQNAVANAIGFDQKRGDSISVVAINFDPAGKADAKAQIDELKAQTAKDQKMQFYKTIGMAALGFIGFIIFLIVILRMRRKNKNVVPKGIDVVVGDQYANAQQNYVPVNLNMEDEKVSVEKDIRKYAEEKPDQVVDIIKSWLAEDER